MSELAITVLALFVVVIGLVILIVVLGFKTRREERAEKLDLASKAAEHAMQEGLRQVRGEAWLRQHSQH